MEGLGIIGVVGDAVFAGAEQLLERMDCGFLVLLAWIGAILGTKGKYGSNIGACACGKPVDGAENALVYLGAALQIRVVLVWWGERVD